MKIIVSIFWSVVIGEVVGYIMTALGGFPDSATWSAGIAVIFGLFVLIFNAVAVEKAPKKS